AGDPEVANRLLLAPHPNQRVPTLLLAAVHDVLLGGLNDPLVDWYSSVQPAQGRSEAHHRSVGAGVDDPWPHFRRLALDDEDVAERLRTRATQTNEVGRCAPLLLAMAQISAGAPGAAPGLGRPLGLVEVGASAGLNLLFDRYAYRYEMEGHPAHEIGSSPLELTCRLRGVGLPPFPAAPPEISSRVGLDVAPVDLADAGSARWLVACQWPDQPERVTQARTAIALAHLDRPRLVVGDAVDDLAPLLEAVPRHALPVVFATWVLSYLPTERQRHFMAGLDAMGDERDLTLVYADQPSLVPGLPLPPRPDGRPDTDATALVRIDWREGQRVDVRIGDQHPHGTWLEWLAD
ncbi:MAG: DUF2332 domain-containing protein, partial [Aquihabitans sp.]